MSDHNNEDGSRSALLDLLTVPEAAKVLTLSPRHTQRLAGTEIPCVRIGPKSLRFRRSDLLAFLESKREGVEA